MIFIGVQLLSLFFSYFYTEAATLCPHSIRWTHNEPSGVQYLYAKQSYLLYTVSMIA